MERRGQPVAGCGHVTPWLHVKPFPIPVGSLGPTAEYVERKSISEHFRAFQCPGLDEELDEARHPSAVLAPFQHPCDPEQEQAGLEMEEFQRYCVTSCSYVLVNERHQAIVLFGESFLQ